MSKSMASLRPTTVGIIVFGAPAMLEAAEQFASGFWRVFCLVGLLGVLHLVQAGLDRCQAPRLERTLRRLRAGPKNKSTRKKLG